MTFESLYAQASDMLDEAVRTRHHGFHLMQVASLTLDGAPDVRTVVMRKHEADARLVAFHTDSRSLKLEALRAHPEVVGHVYDTKSKVQLRLRGRAQVHVQDEVAKAQWANTSQNSKKCYLVEQGPGTEVDASDACGVNHSDVAVDDAQAEALAYEHFSVVQWQYDTLEYLHIKVSGHVRARMWWDEQGRLHGKWLVA